MHNHAFDAKHQFKLHRFTDIEHFASWDETYEEPPAEEYVPRVCPFQLFSVPVCRYHNILRRSTFALG